MSKTADPLSDGAVLAALGGDLDQWAGRCHEASLRVVKTTGVGRVARGVARGVPSQHSWITLGDPYDEEAAIIDPTLWSYDGGVTGVWRGTLADGRHVPHGAGSIWEWGRPSPGDGPVITLPTDGLSREAQAFLRMLGPLDMEGWSVLAHAPVGGWPAGEIIAAMYGVDRLSQHIPIDIVGMVTDLNPSGLYLPDTTGGAA